MNFDPSLKLSTYPNIIAGYFVEEAANMLRELETNRLEVHLKKPVRYATNHNPAWYSKFAVDRSNGHFINKRRKRTDKNRTGGGIRQRTYKALIRITKGNDGKTCGKLYSYDHDLRSLIFERLCDGYYLTVEGYATHPDGAVPGVIKIRECFKVKTPMVVTPMIAELVEDRVPF